MQWQYTRKPLPRAAAVCPRPKSCPPASSARGLACAHTSAADSAAATTIAAIPPNGKFFEKKKGADDLSFGVSEMHAAAGSLGARDHPFPQLGCMVTQGEKKIHSKERAEGDRGESGMLQESRRACPLREFFFFCLSAPTRPFGSLCTLTHLASSQRRIVRSGVSSSEAFIQERQSWFRAAGTGAMQPSFWPQSIPVPEQLLLRERDRYRENLVAHCPSLNTLFNYGLAQQHGSPSK
jgi:hypothetical protein